MPCLRQDYLSSLILRVALKNKNH
ncbi:hypothetical protein PSEUDO8O_150100 [Pseudomonas sp. 8O]|nr:hypothetical protein PSEUDO8O_150100 [Pseudomonas sp. 8O]